MGALWMLNLPRNTPDWVAAEELFHLVQKTKRFGLNGAMASAEFQISANRALAKLKEGPRGAPGLGAAIQGQSARCPECRPLAPGRTGSEELGIEAVGAETDLFRRRMGENPRCNERHPGCL